MTLKSFHNYITDEYMLYNRLSIKKNGLHPFQDTDHFIVFKDR